MPGLGAVGPLPLNGQDLTYYSLFRDWGTVPGTLVCFSWESGAVCGSATAVTTYFGLWELNFFLVDGDGGSCTSSAGTTRSASTCLTERVFGVPGSQVHGLAEYGQLFETVGANYAAQTETDGADAT